MKTHQRIHQNCEIKNKNQFGLTDNNLNVCSCSFKWQTIHDWSFAYLHKKISWIALCTSENRTLRNTCEHQLESQKASIDNILSLLAEFFSRKRACRWKWFQICQAFHLVIYFTLTVLGYLLPFKAIPCFFWVLLL